MSRQASAPYEYHRGMHVDQFENYNNMRQEFGGTFENPNLPPIRRRNNHLPPRSFRAAPIAQMDAKYPLTQNVVFANNKTLTRQSDAESVMIFSHSESDSDDDGSYSDDDSAEQTAYTYADDEHPTTNFNCMNPFFVPTANDHDGNDDGALIRCHRVGPSSAEVQLNIPLPARYMNHLSTVNEGGKRGYMDNVCRAPGLNYSPSQYDPALVDEEVVEVDPYKQFRERIAPQFYESLVELSDEEVDSDGDEDVSEHQRDDSQIFGYFDAHRTAMQQALYNEIVLQQGYVGPSDIQSPPSQIYVTDSGSIMMPEEEPQGGRSMIDLKLGASSDVFSRPNDSHDILLNQHLRETVATGNAKDLHKSTVISDHPLDSSNYDSSPTSHEQGKAILESAPSLDETSTQSHARSGKIQDEAILQIAELNSMSETSGVSSSCVDKYAVIEQAKEDILMLKSTSTRQRSTGCGVEKVTKARVSESRLNNFKLAILPSFDEPGQITAKKHFDSPVKVPQQNHIETTLSQAVELPPLPVNSVIKQDASALVSKQKPTWDENDGPDDEKSRVVQPCEGIGPSLTFLETTTVNENESPTDENVVTTSGNWNIVAPKTVARFLLQTAESSDESVWSQEATVVVKNEDSQKDETAVEEPGIITRRRSITPTYEKPHRAPVRSPKALDDIPLKAAMVRRFVNRPILEETSKANVRTEIYETNTTSETTEKASRELRKDRIRSFEPARSSLPVVPATATTYFPESNHTTDDSDIATENPADEASYRPRSKEIPDLDELMEFHSCDEDFFTSHTDSEPFPTGFA